mgnify:CR=1 FL=1
MKQIGWGFIGCGEVTEEKSGPAVNEVPGPKAVAATRAHHPITRV